MLRQVCGPRTACASGRCGGAPTAHEPRVRPGAVRRRARL